MAGLKQEQCQQPVIRLVLIFGKQFQKTLQLGEKENFYFKVRLAKIVNISFSSFEIAG